MKCLFPLFLILLLASLACRFTATNFPAKPVSPTPSLYQ